MDLFQHKAHTTPKDFFLYIGVVVALYVSAGSLLKLLFDIIDSLYPDPVIGYYEPYSTGMRFAIAALIIVFPIFVVLTTYISKEVAKHEEKKNLGIRKWLIYFTLFVAGIILIGDLVALINTFLNGELTIRFIWKIVAVFLVSGGIFGGLGYVIKKEKPAQKVITILMAISALVVISSIVGGFLIVGSPTEARYTRYDTERIYNLENIQFHIVEFWQNKKRLPNNIDELVVDSISGFVIPLDPETKANYIYEKTGDLTFKLCANFRLENTRESANTPAGFETSARAPKPLIIDKEQTVWNHSDGETCFTRQIDPDIYRPRD